MTVKEIFSLRKQGHIEEAYEAIRPMYRVHPGHYTTICMYHCARDIFNLRLRQGRTEEARKIFLALQKLVLFLSDRDGRVSAFMQYASSRLDGLSRSGVTSCSSPLDGAHGALVPCASPQGSSVALAPSSLSPFLGDSSAPKLKRLLDILHGSMSVCEMMAALNFRSRDKFLKQLSE